jgi:hypothetical protein
MPAEFLSDEQVAASGRFTGELPAGELERFFYLDDADRIWPRGAGRITIAWVSQAFARFLDGRVDARGGAGDPVRGTPAHVTYVTASPGYSAKDPFWITMVICNCRRIACQNGMFGALVRVGRTATGLARLRQPQT